MSLTPAQLRAARQKNIENCRAVTKLDKLIKNPFAGKRMRAAARPFKDEAKAKRIQKIESKRLDQSK